MVLQKTVWHFLKKVRCMYINEHLLRAFNINEQCHSRNYIGNIHLLESKRKPVTLERKIPSSGRWGDPKVIINRVLFGLHRSYHHLMQEEYYEEKKRPLIAQVWKKHSISHLEQIRNNIALRSLKWYLSLFSSLHWCSFSSFFLFDVVAYTCGYV